MRTTWVPGKLIWQDVSHFPVCTLFDTFFDVFCCLCEQSDLAGTKSYLAETVHYVIVGKAPNWAAAGALVKNNATYCECVKTDGLRPQVSCFLLPVNSVVERDHHSLRPLLTTPALITKPETLTSS